MKYLIWDFNGTIINDLEVSMYAINTVAKKYFNRKPLDKDEYRHAFTFPIKKYYENIGFDFSIYSYEEVKSLTSIYIPYLIKSYKIK